MATYLWSTLTDGSTIAFSAASDVLHFDDASISAADRTMLTSNGTDVVFSVIEKSNAALNKTVHFTITGGIKALTDSNVTYLNGSKLLIGDNTQSIGNGTSTFDDAANSLTGTAFNDRFISLGGNDTLNGGAGNDTFVLSNGSLAFGNDSVNGGAGFGDAIGVGTHPSILNGSVVNFTTHMLTSVDGSASFTNIESAFGTMLADAFIAIDPSRVLTGLSASSNNFDYGISLRGYAGNDSFTGDSRAGYFESVTYSDAPAGVVANLATGVASDGYGYTDTLVNIDGLQGSAFNDSLTAGGLATSFAGTRFEQLEGLAGNDTLDATGTPSSVRADYSSSPAGVTVNLLTGTASDGWGGSDTLIGIAGVRGSSFNDTITGNAGGNFLEGRGGDDFIDGGAGSDSIFFSSATSAVDIDLALGSSSLTGGLGTDTWINVEGVRGGDFNDTLRGADGVNNTLEGQAGADLLDGRTGTDVARYDRSPSAVNVNLGTGLAQDGYDSDPATAGIQSYTDTLIGIESVRGSKFNDTIIGSGPSNFIEGWAGNDIINGGFAPDSADYANSPSGVTVNLASGTASDGWGGTDTLISIEYSTGSQFNDSLTGDANSNSLTGLGGNDTLTGGAGADFLSGGSGSDGFVYASAVLPGNADSITDFLIGVDSIQLDSNYLAGLGANGPLNLALFASGPSVAASTAAQRILYDTSTGSVLYDSDGSGAAAAVQLFSLTGAPAVTASSFTVFTGAGTSTYLWSTLTNGSTIAFNAATDVVSFDDASISATERGMLTWTGSDVVFSVADKANAALNKTVHFTIAGGGRALTDSNVTYLNGSKLLVGDNSLSIGNGTSTFDDAANTLTGTAFNDRFQGLGGNDVMDGGAGNDTFVLNNGSNPFGNDTVDGGAGLGDAIGVGFYFSIVNGSTVDFGTHMVTGISGTATFVNIESAFGTNIADTFIAIDPSRVLTGLGASNGNFDYGLSLRGYAGNDAFQGDSRDGYFEVVLYSDAPNGVTANLATGIASDGYDADAVTPGVQAFTDTLVNIDGLQGSAFNDVLIGGGPAKTFNGIHFENFEGLAGNDTLDANGSANDRVSYSSSPAGVTVNLATGTASDGWGGTDTLIGMDGVQGSSFNDSLTGDSSNNYFEGRGGNDFIDGGGGSDSIFFSSATSAVDVDLALGSSSLTGGLGTDTWVGIENARGGDFNDTLRGQDGVDNTLEGLAGADLLDGRTGSDQVRYDRSQNAVTVNLVTGIALDGHDSDLVTAGIQPYTDTLVSIERVRGSKFNDTLIGNASSNDFEGWGGNDVITGDLGTDTVQYNNSPGAVNVNLALGVASDGWGGIDTFTSIENAHGSAFNDILIGNAADNFLRGNAGADFINGGAGRDYADYRNATGAVTVDLGNPLNNTAEAAGDTYVSIESIRGCDFNDTLIGNASSNTLRGGLGADSLNGGGDIDYASYAGSSSGLAVDLSNPANNTGEAVGDTYVSIEALRGSDFNDTLTGNGGFNFLNGGPGADVLNGGGGPDYADYINSAAGLTIDLGNPGNNTGEALGDTYIGIERLRGSNFDDTLVGDAANNALRGGLGADILNGGAGFDAASYSDSAIGLTADLGNSANNTGEAAGDTYVSIESLRGGNFNDTLVGNGSTNFLNGGPGGDALNGAAGFDYADYFDSATAVTVDLNNPASNTGEAAGDSYVSIEGIGGSAFADLLIGNSAVNVLMGGGGADVLNGGADFDFVAHYNVTAAITVDLGNTANNTGEAVGDRYISIEGIIGAAFNDTLTGDGAINILRGNLGADVLNGGANFDFADYTEATIAVTADLGNTANNTGEAAGDVYIAIEGLIGGAFNDTLTGDAGGNVLRGRAGADILNGGAGFDFADYFSAAAAVTVDLGNTAVNTGDALGDVFNSIEGLIGSAFNDTLIGDGGNNFLRGRTGADVLYGGAGIDVADYRNATGGITVDLSNAANNTGEAAGDSYGLIEGIRGGDFNDTLVGDAGANSLDGGLGFDFADYRNATGGIIVDLSNAANNTGVAAGDTYTVIEGLAGGAFNDTLTGDAGDNYLRGQAGADMLNGGAGFDFADYRDATSGLTVDLAAEASNTGEAAGDTFDSIEAIRGSAFGDTLRSDGETNTLIGGAGNDVLVGGAGDDTAVFSGTVGQYTLTKTATGYTVAGVDGTDTLTGIEFAEFDDETVALAVVVPTVLAEGVDSFDGTESAETVDGGSGNDVLTGGGGSDKLLGGVGNDELDGGTGNDKLSGGTGDDTLKGGTGDNLLDGGEGTNDTALFEGILSDYRVTVLDGPNTSKLFFTLNGLEPGDVVNLVSKDGRVDRLVGVENVKFLGDNTELQVTREQLLKDAPVYVGAKYFADKTNTGSLTGTSGDDVLDGLEGDDTLTGLAGNDVLDGGTDTDTMVGGLGNDTYVVDSVTDVVTETAGQGSDLVKTTLSELTLAENVERLEYTGSGDFAGTGNALANTLKGSAGNDTLNGGLGADRMDGGAGDDTYLVDRVASADGSVAGDVVFEGTASADSGGTDTVKASVAYVLGVNQENLVLTGTANLNGTGNTKANTLTGNDGNNVLTGLDGNDTLDGGLGNDTLAGGNGDDTLIASSGNDTITGGAGNDTLNLASLPFTFAEKSKADGFKVERPDLQTVLITDLDTSQKLTIKGAWGAATNEKGIETYVFSDETVTLAQLIADTASAFVDSYAGTSEADSFDGTAGNDATAGAAGNDTLTGGAGDDVMDGGEGNDTMIGGLGNDTYVVDSLTDTVTELLNQGTADVVKTTLSELTLAENVERLEFTGSGNFSGTGNALANTLKGGTGNDTLNGGLGADRMEGGAGDDTYIVDRASTTSVAADGSVLVVAGDTVFEGTAALDAGGADTVNASIIYTLGLNVENLVLTGTANLNGTGNTLGNTITGNDGNNVLSGLDGNDTLDGGAGNDTLNGGNGDDTFTASAGNDTFTGGAGNDTLNLAAMPFTFAEKGKAGGFRVERPDATTMLITDIDSGQKLTIKGAWGAATGDKGIETFVFSDEPAVTLAQLIADTASAFADIFSGTDDADAFDGLAGNDTINGGAENDTLAGGAGDDTLDGGTGDDTLAGGLGNDTFIVDSAVDAVSEALGQGTDLVKTALASMTLADKDNVEKLEYTGAGGFSGTGNALANTITGGAGEDTLDGGAGADTLRGLTGNDTYLIDNAGDRVTGETLDGGTADTVQTTLASLNLTALDAAGAALFANIEQLVYAGSGDFTGTGNALDNQITGGAGHDRLSGGAGNDLLSAGVGNDRYTGGTGADRFVFDDLIAGAGTNTSTVTDFSAAQGDRIVLSVDVYGGVAGNALSAEQFVQGTAALDANVFFVYNRANGQLSYDQDGSGDGAAVLIGVFSNLAQLSAVEFVFG